MCDLHRGFLDGGIPLAYNISAHRKRQQRDKTRPVDKDTGMPSRLRPVGGYDRDLGGHADECTTGNALLTDTPKVARRSSRRKTCLPVWQTSDGADAERCLSARDWK